MRIDRCRVLSQRFFDIADEIDLVRAEAYVKELSRRPRFVGSTKQIRIPDPPLEMALAPRPCGIPELPEAEVVARVYSMGVVSVTFCLDLPAALEPEELVAYGARVLDAEEAVTEAARPIVDEIAVAIATACEQGDVSGFTEDYTIFAVQKTTPHASAAELLEHLDVARLLVGERAALAAAEQQRVTRTRFSYHPDELVVVDWNSALVYDPREATHVPYLLELTTVQLLNLRTYDELVGRALDQLYAELDMRGSRLFTASRYRRMSQRIMRLFVDVIETTERSETSLQYFGDTWLAGIHRAAMAVFDIPRWQSQLRHKLDVMGQLNRHVMDQGASGDALAVELAIVFLILVEILLALFRLI